MPFAADALGEVHVSQAVPPAGTGHSIWFHGVDLGSGVMLNPLATVIG